MNLINDFLIMIKKLTSSQLEIQARLRFNFKFCIFNSKMNLGFDKTEKKIKFFNLNITFFSLQYNLTKKLEFLFLYLL